DSYRAVFVFHSEDNARLSVTGSYASTPLLSSSARFPLYLSISHSLLSSLWLP
ncbi:unnamed protein product, partial [Hymenolepis diminuta]